MTEYDYSPDAYERHIAKQSQIARWVDQTKQHPAENPFMPLPGERGPPPAAAASTVGPSGSALGYSPPAQQYPNPSQYQYHYNQYPNVNPYAPYPAQAQAQAQVGQPQPYPAFYTTAGGLISPTYSSKTHKPKSKHSSHRHRSGTRSLHPSPPSGSIALPQQAQLAYPMTTPPMMRSISTPPMVLAQNGGYGGVYTTPATSPYTSPTLQQMNAQSAAAAYPGFASYSNQNSPGPSPFPSPMTRGGSSSRLSSAHHSPRSHASAPLGGHTYVQRSTNQPVVVSIGGGHGGYVVVPAAGQRVQVISPQYHQYQPQYQPHDQYPPYARSDGSDRDGGQSFFGSLGISNFSLRSLGRKKSSKKSSRSGRERRDSY